MAGPNLRVTQEVVEPALSATANARFTQDVVEAALLTNGHARFTQTVVEAAVIFPFGPHLRVTQHVAESALSAFTTNAARFTQVVVEAAVFYGGSTHGAVADLWKIVEPQTLGAATISLANGLPIAVLYFPELASGTTVSVYSGQTFVEYVAAPATNVLVTMPSGTTSALLTCSPRATPFRVFATTDPNWVPVDGI